MQFHILKRFHSVFWGGMASILVMCVPVTSANAYFAPLRTFETPEALPALNVVDSGGIPQDITGLERPLTVIHVWATWCAPCVEELPMVNWLANTFKGRGMYVMSVSLDGIAKKDKVRQFYFDHNINALPVLFDKDNTISKILTIKSVPTTLFVADGDIIARADGVLDWQSQPLKMLVLKRLAEFSQHPDVIPGN